MAEAAGAEPAGRTINSSRSSVAEQSLDKRSTDVRFITGGPDSMGGHHERELGRRRAPSLRREPGRACPGKGSGASPRATPSWRAMQNRRGWPPQPSRRWIRSVKPEWRWSGLLTRAHVVRNHPDPPQRTCAPSGQGSGFLIRRESIVGSSPTRSSKPIRARGETGRRAVSRGRWETMPVRSRPSAPMAQPMPMSPSGEGTGLSIREGEFDPRHGRHSRSSLARPKQTPRARETAGSNPANPGV